MHKSEGVQCRPRVTSANCDSNGGSFSRGKIMRVRSQQWPWFAILVKTGREKSTNLLLENAGYECFLPVNRSTRRWSDRTKLIDVPLFPGYLDRKSTRLNSSHTVISYAVFCLKKKRKQM